ncbi:tyrosine-protein kinase STYK1b isoform X1 [Amia ocellicauda]|uniref:tyrosine-protein kinase STYK1b isoform X1 n=2 Tax=Amia ocellicauda TaxID=2972642 RepID=UPI003464AC49
MSSLTGADYQCEPNQTLCNIRVYQQEIIIVPILFLASFLIVFTLLMLLRYCPEKVQPKGEVSQRGTHKERNRHRGRSHLQGVDAPPGLDPLENEFISLDMVPRAACLAPLAPKPPALTASSTSSTVSTSFSLPPAPVRELPQQCLPESFGQITPLPSSFCLKAGRAVSLYRARMDNRDVILRVLRGSASPSESHQFLEFARFLGRLGPHPHLVEVLGVVSVRTPLITVTEELQQRDLLGYLWRRRQENVNLQPPRDITEKRIFIIARQVCSALEYLHNQGCLHGNVAARSVLIGGDLTAKLWGLGTSFRAHIRGTLPTGEEAGLQKWQAPELLAKKPATYSCDVWSFGILLFEMVTLGEAPFPDISVSELLQYLQRGKTVKKPASCSTNLYSLIKSCCQWRQQDRISLADLLRKLQSGEKSANDKTVLQAAQPIDIEKYLQEAGYGASYNYTVF